MKKLVWLAPCAMLFSSAVHAQQIGSPLVVTQPPGTNSKKAASTEFVNNAVSGIVGGRITALVGNNAQLSALASTSVSAGAGISRLGYAVSGDAPAVTYTPSTSACSLNSGAGDGGSQVPSADGKCWIAALSSPIDVRIFGVACDGTTNDTPRLTALMAAMGSAGGTVTFPRGMKCLIDTYLTVPDNIYLVGPYNEAGAPGPNTSMPWGNLGAVMINPAVSISLGNNSGVKGLVVYRKGMTFPANDASLYAGTAFRANGDDVSIERTTIIGFDLAYGSLDHYRAVIDHLYMDNNNGVSIAGSADLVRITNVQAWPFGTIAGVGANRLNRSGTAFKFQLGSLINGQSFGIDGLKMYSNLIYGYTVGIQLDNVIDWSIIDTWVDNIQSHTGTTGISLTGASAYGGILTNVQISEQQTGLFMNTNTGTLRARSMTIWGDIPNTTTPLVATNAINILNGNIDITGSAIRTSTGNGIVVQSTDSQVQINGTQFDAAVTNPIVPTVGTSNIIIGKDNIFKGTALPCGGNCLVPALTSASAITIPSNNDAFNIVGTTGIGTLGGGWAGRTVTLYFTGGLPVYSSTGASTAMRLKGGATFGAVAGSSLTLKHNGAQWYEISRAD